MREFIAANEFGARRNRPRIYGDIRYHDVFLNSHQRARVEKEIGNWILLHNLDCDPKEEIQYWVTFTRNEPNRTTTCRIEIFGPLRVWESLETSPEPFKAFRRSVDGLSPVLLNIA